VHHGCVKPSRTGEDKHDAPHHGWVLLAFRLPREPSTPRIALWRKLRRLGAVQLVDGLVALPLDDRNREQLEWLAEGVIEAGGEATVWLGRPAARDDERGLVDRVNAQVAAAYQSLIEETTLVRAQAPSKQRRSLARLRRQLHRIRARDYFSVEEREFAVQAVDRLAQAVEELVS
jgi:hypothetical protein